MRSRILPEVFLEGFLALLSILLLPVCAMAFGGGVGVAAGHGGGVGLAIGHGGGPGLGVGHGGGFGHGLGGGAGPGIGGGDGPGIGGGDGSGIGGGDGPGIGGGAGHGGGDHGAPGGGPEGHSAVGPGGDGPGASGGDGPGVDSSGSGGAGPATASPGNSGAGGGDGGSGGALGADNGGGQVSAGSAVSDSGTGGDGRAAYGSRRAQFLRERASLEMGMGLRRPDRGIESALKYSREHPGGWSWGSPAQVSSRPRAATPQVDSVFRSAVQDLPALPSFRNSHPVTNLAQARVFDPPVAVHPPTLMVNPQRILVKKKPVSAPDQPKTASSQLAQNAQAAGKVVLAITQPAPVQVVGGFQQGALNSAPESGPRLQTTLVQQLQTSLVNEAPADPAFRFTSQDWSIVGPFSAERTAPLPKRGPILLIVFLSALSAYVFVRWTSVRCPQCGKLLEAGSLTCRRCRARLGPIRA